MNTELKNLLDELEVVNKKAGEILTKIHFVNDGYHYRVEFWHYGSHWDREYPNEYEAKQAALRCYCADEEGFATLHTNNPDILNDEEFDWGEVKLEFEE